MTELPSGWARALLSDIAEVRLGRQRSPKRATGDRMRPYLRAANVGWQGLKLDDVKEMDFSEPESATYELRPGDLLLAEASGSAGEVGKPAQFRGEIDACCFQNTLIRVRLRNGLLPDFYEHFFRHEAMSRRFADGSRGVGIHHLGAATLSNWMSPVPPPSEQGRIVAAIEEAFSLLDAGETALHNTRTRLKRMRDAVLTAAVTGRLVPQDPTDTPAALGLSVAGASPVDVSGTTLPTGWVCVTLSDLLAETIGGVWGTEAGTGDVDVHVLRVTEMKPDGELDPRTAVVRAVTASQLRSRQLVAGDLLLEKSGGGPTRPVGRVGMVRSVDGPSVCANFMQLLRADARIVSPAYLELLLRQFHSSGGTAALQTATTNIRNLKMKDYFATTHAVPPLDEQVRIVAEVERQFSFIEAAERAVETGLRRSAGLRRSVLKAAFEGRLVAQDPGDEPASVLLERIAAERAAAAPRTRRAPRRVRGEAK